MNNLLSADGVTENGGKSAWLQIVRQMKEKLCFVAPDYQTALNEAKSSDKHTADYELPDGTVVKINTPRFSAPEALFNTGLIKEGDETEGMH